MKQLLQYSVFFFILFFAATAHAQNTQQDSVIQLYGVVMTADSLDAIPSASVIVEDKLRGTFTNGQGVFSIVVLKGDVIRFSCVGFKDKLITIPRNLNSNQYSIIQLMVTDTAYLPATILRPRPSRSQFERDFVNTYVPADAFEIARQNTSEATRRALIAALPADGREAVSAQMRATAQKYTYQGQVPPQNIFNPMAWAEFIQAWKRGDFKKKN
ncbi:carboxypeptidase-like regulatory domain-containing protein [Limnovirga soli]|jgi:CarboxypepD_reg-like domain|uniref:Carboxypeptidase-like regulatory domain-containing protein n=1 Tax=Limnovirga soli TaxID=2656915 RepID=A0A8J8JYM1_9BACT|nr:carboxypeptidase-like regulatory domain-containing protein [Limnovirga soli]NNV57441.1 carboxypeptidase-like regulatory domain-containing protein [Limnovirga soli]